MNLCFTLSYFLLNSQDGEQESFEVLSGKRWCIVEFNQKCVALSLQADRLAATTVVGPRMLKRIFDIFPVAVDFSVPIPKLVEMDLWFLHFYHGSF